MATPCDNCPFRTDVDPYLTRERVQEIISGLAEGGSFSCHKTVDYDADDDGEGGGQNVATTQQCAGAEILLAHQGTSTQMGRIAERLGMPVATLDMDAPVFRNAFAMADHHGGGPEREHVTCKSVEYGCTAPAGVMVGGVAMPPEDPEDAEHVCPHCDEPVCDNCAVDVAGKPHCTDCAAELEGAA